MSRAETNPPHSESSFALLALFSLGVEVLTGVLLLVYYNPSAAAAHRSVGVIVDEVRLGWMCRSLHYWGASLFIAFSLLHLVRVYFARAYVAPQRLAWVSGVLLLVAALAFGFTGTLLPWDQYAYWSIDAARRTIAGIPFVGSLLLSLFWGGWEIGPEVLLRFYAFHVGILPWAVVALVGIHLVTSWRAGGGRVGDEDAATAIATGVVPFCMLAVSLAVLFPPRLREAADPLSPVLQVRPRWYFVTAHHVLAHLSGGVAALVVVLLFGLLLLVPLIDRRPAESRAGWLLRWAIGVAVVAVAAGLVLREALL